MGLSRRIDWCRSGVFPDCIIVSLYDGATQGHGEIIELLVAYLLNRESYEGV